MSDTNVTFDVEAFFSGQNDLTLEDIAGGRRRLFADPEAVKAMREEVKTRMAGFREGGIDDNTVALRLGVALYFLGHLGEALEVLDQCKRLKLGPAVIGMAQLEVQRFDAAREMLEKACDDVEEVPVALLGGLCEARRMSGDEEGAVEIADVIERRAPETATHHYTRGIIAEMDGDIGTALGHYQAATDIDEEDQRALFRLAYNLDLRGEDEFAIETYLQCNAVQPVYVNALVNLGVLYEDAENYGEAIECFNQVVKYYPNHTRARLFLRDARSSTSMYYDEEKERRADKRQKVLDVPVTDFELSVRSRNCLEKMNIRTLGDLTRISEQDLLKFKNFGETSLNEIKEMVTSKGLRLGQALEEGQGGASSGDVDEQHTRDDSLLGKLVTELDLSIRARRAIDMLNCDTIGDLVAHSEEELLGLKNFGQTSLNEIKQRLEELGLSLGHTS